MTANVEGVGEDCCRLRFSASNRNLGPGLLNRLMRLFVADQLMRTGILVERQKGGNPDQI